MAQTSERHDKVLGNSSPRDNTHRDSTCAGTGGRGGLGKYDIAWGCDQNRSPRHHHSAKWWRLEGVGRGLKWLIKIWLELHIEIWKPSARCHPHRFPWGMGERYSLFFGYCSGDRWRRTFYLNKYEYLSKYRPLLRIHKYIPMYLLEDRTSDSIIVSRVIPVIVPADNNTYTTNIRSQLSDFDNQWLLAWLF